MVGERRSSEITMLVLLHLQNHLFECADCRHVFLFVYFAISQSR